LIHFYKRTMPPLKRVPTLVFLACGEVTKLVSLSCCRIEKHQQASETLGAALLDLPINLLETVILSSINVIIKKVDRYRDSQGLPTALEVLPQPCVTVLDYGQLFTGTRLSRTINTQCRSAIRTSLTRTVMLTKLVLSSKCTNDILETLGRNCVRLKELHISSSELVTDAGMSWLVPCVSQIFTGSDNDTSLDKWAPHAGCPALVAIDLLKCWNISPSGAKLLLLGLKKLRKLMYSNMKSVIESLCANSQDNQGPWLLEYFDSTEYDLITDYSTEVIPGTNPACWMSGPVRMTTIPKMFPNITTIKMMLTDAEVQNLVNVPNLVHLEVEFSDDPGPGLQNLVDNHPNNCKFDLLFLQVGTILASHLLSIGKNCSKLGYLRIIGFQVGNCEVLIPCSSYFQSLTQIHLSLYDTNVDSSEEDEEEGLGAPHTPEIITFFLSSARNLKVIIIHMNCDTFLTDLFLHQLFYQNPLSQLTRLSLSGPKDLKLTLATVEWVVASLPMLTRLTVSKWSVGLKELKTLRNNALSNNYDLVYD